MSGERAAASETILCDTSFVSVVQSASRDPRSASGVEAWPATVKARLNAAILAISVITLGELRAGQIYANWGAARRAAAEALVATYLLVGLDMATVDCWAKLDATCRRTGIAAPDNDVWIAATAISRDWPLVSCDGHFDLIPGVDHVRLRRP
jgi:predicted nucleic acid-binding protein